MAFKERGKPSRHGAPVEPEEIPTAYCVKRSVSTNLCFALVGWKHTWFVK